MVKKSIIPLVFLACTILLCTVMERNNPFDPSSKEYEEPVNRPPTTPLLVSPPADTSDLELAVTLSWTCSDSDLSDTISYAVLLDTVNPPLDTIGVVIHDTTYEAISLSPATDYYWSIQAADGEDFSQSEIRKFTTMDTTTVNSPPNAPSNPSPESLAVDIAISVTLSWTGGDPDTNDNVTYDVWLGKSNPPVTRVGTGQSDTAYEASGLTSNTVYYWYIVASDDSLSTTGTVWSFTTREAPVENTAPNTPSNPSPVDSAEDRNLSVILSWTGGDADTNDNAVYDVWLGTTNPPETKIATGQSDTTCEATGLDNSKVYYWYIVASDGKESVTGEVWRFTTKDPPLQNTPPKTPADPSPTDSAEEQNISVTLSWSGGDEDAGDTVTYDVWFGTTNPPATRVATGQSDTAYEASGLNNNTVYYWYIVASDGKESVTGEVWRFTTKDAPPQNTPPNTPVGPAPQDSAQDTDTALTLSWSGGDDDEDDTITYNVWFGASNPPTTRVANGQSDTACEVTGLNYSTLYYWYIVASDNKESTTGTLWRFTTKDRPNTPPYTPAGPSPQDSAENRDTLVELSWTGGDPDADDAVVYDLYFGLENPPTEIVSEDQSDTVYSADCLLYDTTYYWQVKASDGKDSAEGPVWRFSTKEAAAQNIAPDEPSNPSPEDDAGNTDTALTLSWTGGDPDVGDTALYDVYFGTDNPPTSQVSDDQEADSFEVADLEYSTTYYWQVKASDGEDSTAGPVWQFTTMDRPNTPPNTPAAPIPVNSSVDQDTALTMNWTGGDPDAGDVVVYDVYLGITNPPATRVASDLSNRSLSINSLSYDQYYYWRVVAKDGTDTTAGPVWTFTTKEKPNTPPNTPAVVSPADNAVNCALSLTLLWTGGDPDAGDVVVYDVYFGTAFPPTTLAANDQSSTNFALYGLSDATVYYWFVVASDGADSTIGPVWQFTTENRVPYNPTYISPSLNAMMQDTALTLLWHGGDPDTTDTVVYDVYLGTANPPTARVANDHSDTSLAIDGLSYSTDYYWKIISNDGTDSAAGPVWHFTTKDPPNTPPNTPSDPTPADNATDQDTVLTLSWTGGDPDAGDNVYYDIRYGTTTPPSGGLVYGLTSPSYQADEFNLNTRYYWQVIAYDDKDTTEGPVWQFKTTGFWGDTASIPPATTTLMFVFLNRTNGAYTDDEIYYTIAGNTYNIADQPMYEPTGYTNGRVTINLGSQTSDYTDYFEYSVGPGNIACNTTRVDGWGLPLALMVYSSFDDSTQIVGDSYDLFDMDRDDVFQAFKDSAPTQFHHLADNGYPYRIISAGDTIYSRFRTGETFEDYMDAYLADEGYTTSTTIDVFACLGGVFGSNPNLAAAFNRHVAHLSSSQWTDSELFYQGAPANFYAKFWHDHGIDGKAYGFPYDDSGGFASYIYNNDADFLVIAIGY